MINSHIRTNSFSTEIIPPDQLRMNQSSF